MHKLLINHSNKLINTARVIAKVNNITQIPAPSPTFKNKKAFEKYLNNLTNFIQKPELFYLVSNIKKVNIDTDITLKKKNFPFMY